MRRNLFHAIWSWLRGDAIRSSPTERIWLTIEPPCVLLWQGEQIEVLGRREISTDAGIAIQFECLTPRGRENLMVHPGGLHQPPMWKWTSPAKSSPCERAVSDHL